MTRILHSKYTRPVMVVLLILLLIWRLIPNPPSWYSFYVYLTYAGIALLMGWRAYVGIRQLKQRQSKAVAGSLLIISALLALSSLNFARATVDLGCLHHATTRSGEEYYLCTPLHSVFGGVCSGIYNLNCDYDCVKFERQGQLPLVLSQAGYDA